MVTALASIIKTENLTYIYGKMTPFERTAIKDINLEVEEGEILGIIGHTGSGKSTLIQHLNGLLRPSSGRVFLSGRDIWEKDNDMRRVRFKVGLVFQYPEYQLFEETVYKDIAFGPKNMGLSEKETAERVNSALDFVGLNSDILEKSPFELSGGQKRRVAIAGVIAMRPEVIIFDEPTAGLDPRGCEDILNHIKRYHQSGGVTVILVTHSMEEIARMVNRLIVMNKAGIEMHGTPGEIFSRAEALEACGLSVPQITKVFMRLGSMGLDVSSGIYTMEQAVKELFSFYSERGGAGA